MATSGNYTYTITRDQLINASFALLGVYNDDNPAPPSEITSAAMVLNIMIKELMTQDYFLWCVEDIYITPIPFVTTYTLGPVGNTDFISYKPLRIPMARFRYNATDPLIETPLIQLSRQEYMDMSQKDSLGTVNSYYYDPQRDMGLLYLYPAPDDQNITIICTVQRPIQSMTDSTTTFDFPVENYNLLRFRLAAELMYNYDIPTAKADRIQARADKITEDMIDWSQEEASTYFSPDNRNTGYGRF